MPAVGDVLAGRYRIDGRLGAGGMATVWRARDLRLDRDVAVKVLLPNLAGDPAMAARFDREARTLAAIADPRVVSVFDVADGDPASGREPFLVMELCPDGSLGTLLDARGTLTEPALVPLLADAAEGLAALHARGLVHRDVSPRNVLLGGGRAKLGDLGLARQGIPADVTLGLTPPGVTFGTIAYVAPEVRAGGSAGPAADVYGLGAVAYRALTGSPPPSSHPVGADDRGPVPVGDLTPTTSGALAELVTAALATDPRARPTAAAMAARLRDLAARSGIPAETAWAGVAAAAPASPGTTAIAPTHVAAPPAAWRSSGPPPKLPPELPRWLPPRLPSDLAPELPGCRPRLLRTRRHRMDRLLPLAPFTRRSRAPPCRAGPRRERRRPARTTVARDSGPASWSSCCSPPWW